MATGALGGRSSLSALTRRVKRAPANPTKRGAMARVTIKVAVDLPRAVSKEDWREVVTEQLTENIPESVYYTTEDGTEHEMSAEVVE